MKNPLISVIVPCYNVEKYVAECLKSIVEQSYENLEIIVVNDGATDNTEQEILPFLEDKRIKYIVQKNQGLSGARNKGLDNMNGEYVCFVDSDDFIHPDFVKTLYQNLIENDADMSICGLYQFEDSSQITLKEDKSQIHIYSRDKIMREVLSDWQLIVAWNKLYKKELFREQRFELGRIHEDEFLAHHIFWKTKKVVKTASQFYFYRQTQGSIMNSNYTDKKMMDCIAAMDDRIAFFQKHNIPNISKIYDIKWHIITRKGIETLHLLSAQKYLLTHPMEFLTKMRGSKKAKIEFYLRTLREFIRK